jgi:hypothetical protein
MKAAVTIEWGDAPEGPRFMRIDPSPAMIPATPGDARTGAHADVDLGAGLRARVRLSLTDGEARAASPALDALRAAVATVPIPPHGRSDIDVRLADVVVAWNVLRHFYPYWAEARVDWDARLRPQLEAAARAQTRAQHFVALRQLVADLRDAHGTPKDR